jgi:hypothetical protein
MVKKHCSSLLYLQPQSVLFLFKFYREYADKRIKQAGHCDARIESILLDVNVKRKQQVFVVIITLNRPTVK